MARGQAKKEKGAKSDAAKRASREGHGSSRSKKTPSRSSVAKTSRLFSTPALILGPRLMFIVSIVALCTLGVIMIYSASSIEAFSSSGFGNNPSYFLQRQVISLAVGVVACVVCAFIPYRFWAKKYIPWVLWAVAIVLLLGVYFKGDNRLGATRSLDLGFFELQPSEFAKIAVLILDAYLVEKIVNGELSLWPQGLLQIGLSTGLALALIYIQPDLGTAMILFMGILALLILCGVPWKVIGGVIAVIAAYFVFVCIVQPYHIDRIVTTFNPDADKLGDGFQSVQGFLALGNGGFFGTGLGLSRQKYNYLPYAYNDFIFAVVGEELGFIGAAVVILLFALFIFAGLRISHSAPDLYAAMVSGSLTTMVGFQACLNIACVLGVAPVTGKALPFLSYGGSSLLATMIICGLVLGISRGSKIDAQNERRRDNLLVVDGGASRNNGRVPAATQHRAPSLGGLLSGAGSALGAMGARLNGKVSSSPAGNAQNAPHRLTRATRKDSDAPIAGRRGASSDTRGGRPSHVRSQRPSGTQPASGEHQPSGTRRRGTRSRDMDLDLVDIVPKSGRRPSASEASRSSSKALSRPRSSSASHGRAPRGSRRPANGYGSASRSQRPPRR